MARKYIINPTDKRLRLMLMLVCATTAILLALIILFLLKESLPFFSRLMQNAEFSSLFKSDQWFPLEGQFGMAPMIMASLAVMLGAVVIALPLGLACAIFLECYTQSKFTGIFRLLLNLLAGIPSVVFGLWGLTRLVPLITQWQPPGASLLAAILVLALMILPTIALTCASAIASVPKDITAGAMALGFRRKTYILYVLLPAAKSGIASGVLLATARAIGETLAVLMVAGNVVQFPVGLFEPVRVLTANIALEMAYAMGDHRASLFASGLLLTALVWLISWLAHSVSYEKNGGAQHG